MTFAHVHHMTSKELYEHIDYEGIDVRAIVTSPPYPGLDGRADNSLILVYEMLEWAAEKLDGFGSITIIAGSSKGNISFPFDIIQYGNLMPGLKLGGVVVWDRRGELHRETEMGFVNHDYLIRFVTSNRQSDYCVSNIGNTSVTGIGSVTSPFDYGDGVVLPPRLAGELVRFAGKPFREKGWIVDPFAGLGEVGVQAKKLKLNFIGSDNNKACADIANRRLANV